MKALAAASFLAITAVTPAAALEGPLVDPASLQQALSTEDVQIIDIREAEGDDGYASGHIQGAVSAPYPLFRGPSDNPGQVPDLASLEATVEQLGLRPDQSLVVTYQGASVSDFGAAARVYWTLKSLGFEDLAILNGGIEAWSEAGLALSGDGVTPVPTALDLAWDDSWTATTDDVRAIVDGEAQARLVDARPESFWKGEQAHPAAARPGTLPQSEYFVHSSWFDDGPAIIDAEAASRLAQEAGLEGPVVSFCNTGHWAATNWFAMSELAGLDARLYPESMVGWSNAGYTMANVPSRLQNLWRQITDGARNRTAIADIEAGARERALAAKFLLCLSALALVFTVALFAGARYGILLAIGLGFGVTLEGLRFGFAGPWRALITRREAGGTLAQLLSIALVSLAAFPMIQWAGSSVVGAHAPVGWAMIGGAFVFGAAMQVVMGCGSGTLVNAGSCNPVSLVALPFFALGSFAGAAHLFWWTGLGTLPTIALQGGTGLMATLGLLAVAAICVVVAAEPGKRAIPPRLWIAAGLLAVLALANLAVAGQPWGVVYGLGLWAAKGMVALGADLSGSAFWAAPANQTRLFQSMLTDVTSLTNMGIIAGAFGVAAWRGTLSARLPALPRRAWLATVVAGFLLGYASRLAFGCNVGAFFSGISTGSLHGWVWFVAAFGGAFVGIRLRPWLGLEARA